MISLNGLALAVWSRGCKCWTTWLTMSSSWDRRSSLISLRLMASIQGSACLCRSGISDWVNSDAALGVVYCEGNCSGFGVSGLFSPVISVCSLSLSNVVVSSEAGTLATSAAGCLYQFGVCRVRVVFCMPLVFPLRFDDPWLLPLIDPLLRGIFLVMVGGGMMDR